MKKIYLFAGALAFMYTGAFAQSTEHMVKVRRPGKATILKASHSIGTNKAIPDTAGLNDWIANINGSTIFWGSVGNSGGAGDWGSVIYDSSQAGTLVPSEFNGTLVRFGADPTNYSLGANQYMVTSIIGAAVSKNYNPANSGPTSVINAKVYYMDGLSSYTMHYNDGDSTIVSNLPAPQTVLATGSATLASIDTTYNLSKLFVIPLSSPAHINVYDGYDWGIYLDFRDIYAKGDSLGIGTEFGYNGTSVGALPTWPIYASSSDYVLANDTSGFASDWIRYSDYFKGTFSFLPAVFGVIENDTTLGIKELSSTYTNGLRMFNAPNPSRGNTVINYSLRNSGYAKLMVMNAQGKVIYKEEGMKQGGVMNKVQFTKGQLAPGMYFYTLFADNQHITMKMVITE